MAAAAAPSPSGVRIEAPAGPEPRHIKFVILGDAYTGKTSLAHRFCEDRFSVHYTPTNGMEIFEKTVKISLGPYAGSAVCCLELWDVSGQMMVSPALCNLLADADVVLLVYDMTQPVTFRMVRSWLKVVETYLSIPIPRDPRVKVNPDDRYPLVALVGTKSDLTSLRMVTEQAHTKLAEELGFSSFFVSCKITESVYSVFLGLTGSLFGVSKEEPQAKPPLTKRLSVVSFKDIADIRHRKRILQDCVVQ